MPPIPEGDGRALVERKLEQHALSEHLELAAWCRQATPEELAEYARPAAVPAPWFGRPPREGGVG